MKFCWIWIGVVVVLGVVCVRSASLSLPKDPFFGIAPEDEKYYKTSSDTIKCKDGSNKFTKSQLNDDFCDCPDGTDEPGTSACPAGKFYCRNAGHAPLLLYSSRVNDGICDCCDGSDEYDGKVKCPNTCWESGKVARDKLKTKIATYQEGVALRKQEVEQAKLAVAKDEAELSQLRSEEKILKGLVQQLKERKEQIEKAEEKERLQKEKEEEKERLQKEKEAEGVTEKKNKPEDEAKQEESKADEKADNVGQVQPTGSAHDDKIGLLGDSPSDQDATDYHDSAAKVEHSDTSRNEGSSSSRVEQYAVEDKEETILPESKESAVVSETGLSDGNEVSPDEVMEVRNDVSENTEDLSREELGRLVASRWTGEKAGKQTEEVDGVKDNDEGHERTPEYTHDEEYDGYASETDEDNHKYDNDIEDEVEEDIGEEDHDDASYSYKADSDDDGSELSDITTPSNPSWLEKIQHTVRNILQAVNLFQTPVDQSEAARVRKEYEESSTRLSKIQSRISSLTQKLKHDFGPEKEFYSFYGRCFEGKQNKYVYKVCPFKQASQEEGHSTTRLGNWDKFDDSYKVMLFSNGDKCWNGPDRSMKVKLRCGLKNEVADVDEPSRCEYVALLSTPSLCVEEKLKELQHKVDMMNKEQPQSHDEL